MKVKVRIALTLALLLVIVACTKRPVNPDAVVANRQAQAQKIVLDFTTSVIALNHEKKISDELEITLLRIDQQVSDVIRDNPTNWLDGAKTIVKNGLEALPETLRVQVKTFLDGLLQKLSTVLAPAVGDDDAFRIRSGVAVDSGRA